MRRRSASSASFGDIAERSSPRCSRATPSCGSRSSGTPPAGALAWFGWYGRFGVRILSGPFRGHLAIYADMAGHERVAVLLKIFGGQQRVTLAERDVEVIAI